jgi:ribosomal protein S13
MSLIGEITLINQNTHVPAVVAGDYVAREVVSKEVQKLLNKEKELKVNEVKEVEEIEKILPEDDAKEEVEREIKNHIDIRA